MPEHPLELPVRALTRAFADGTLSPSEFTAEVLERIGRLDPYLHAYLTVTGDLAREQARRATETYRRGEWDTRRAPLLGVPVSIKDAFHLRGVETTLGSLVHRGEIAESDSGVVRRLRAAGGVFTGKTNTAEFGQSATTDNLLGPATGNPWDPDRTAGGSSGGAAASVAAGMAAVAVGSDGGGSVRIPAAFCGLVGVKPTWGLCPDEGGFRAMTEFASPGPLTRYVDDARVMLGVLADSGYPRRKVPTGLRVAWCPRPEDRPVDPGVAALVKEIAMLLAEQGHRVEEHDAPVEGWQEIFGPLVLDDEDRERRHLLVESPDLITGYQLSTLRAARHLPAAEVDAARRALPRYRARAEALFESIDILVTPATAVPAFPLGERPRRIDGQPVSSLWGAFPFAVPFNVAGVPALSLPCGTTASGLPVGVQLVAAPRAEQLLLDVAEDIEDAVAFDRGPLWRRWSPTTAGTDR
ncbi:aspartyl-tRNA(Asn)/glutamyl-tRNA(Gln) amidotransferase subunit A [Actinomadura madurae]|uniref:Aspartyl-tRNA(Asn)/glutamyl-tRNA(Gln) amidotransferase subunit A n=1 Tax=Actinomadura madurae TaxID=1993 RepID=A0A1I5KR04_9ACTN|nr:amidase [Actinomadura madurae]SFO87580.1 aspartyl-tRNA(Asn)/glutamyl-tRNA(Gln) amidotransferase subunit A [Actinomadura madurae]